MQGSIHAVPTPMNYANYLYPNTHFPYQVSLDYPFLPITTMILPPKFKGHSYHFVYWTKVPLNLNFHYAVGTSKNTSYTYLLCLA